MNCPLCDQKSIVVRTLTSQYMAHSVGKYFGSAIDDSLIGENYTIRRCGNCSLEFADPLVPGSDDFYEWITSQKAYYPRFRKEYGAVQSLIKSYEQENRLEGGQKLRLIDIGCGSGDFLEVLKKNRNLDLYGIDTTESSVKICKAKGLNVSCSYLDELLAGNENFNAFDFVTSFHVLEHVPQPFQFVADMKKLLVKDGCIFLSTPYSPMSIESDWFDPLNHPPHHMTRWNERAYQELARRLNMSIRLFQKDQPSGLRSLTPSD